jgi:ABC-2 type transport system permease protein
MDFSLGFREYNILKSGFDMTPFLPYRLDPDFPYSGRSMRSFFRRKKTRHLELLLTKPLSIWQIVNGKFLECSC